MTTGNFLDILILFGSIQGFISAFLLFKKKKHVTNYLLGWILIITSLACLNIYLFQVIEGEVPFIIHLLERIIPLIIFMPLGPLIYFFVRASLGTPFQLKRERLHFAPVILDLVPSIVSIVGIVLYFVGLSETIESSGMADFNDNYNKYVDIPRWISATIYLIAASKMFLGGFIHGKKKAWLRQFLLGFAIFQILWLLHLIPYLMPATSNWLLGTLSWYPIYVPLTILVYWLGFNGVIQSRSNQYVPKDQGELKDTVERLNELIRNELLFLNPTLSLTGIVEKSRIDQKTISAALNQYLGKSFNEYVNEFRVEEVKRKMKSNSYNHLSITGIALESGFNSQATFQRAFKAATNMTPKAFRASISNEDE